MTFPRLRQDGTFAIRIEFSSAETIERSTVDAWLSAWIKAADPWERRWRGAGGQIVQVEQLHLRDALLEAPRCTATTESGVSIELTGRAGGKYWKDWMVRLIEDVVSELGLRFVKAVDAVPQPSKAE